MTKKVFIVLFGFFLIAVASAQSTKRYSQKDFDRNSKFSDVYEFIDKKVWRSNKNDTLSYFVDNRAYKGVLNYGVKIESVSKKSFHFVETFTLYRLNVVFNTCRYASKTQEIEIEGVVSGGWTGGLRKGSPKNYLTAFLGVKKDTIFHCLLGNACYKPLFGEGLLVSQKGKKIGNETVLDSFPAFYMKPDKSLDLPTEGDRPFKIKGKINSASYLVFGGLGCYSEVFDIGAMVFRPSLNNINSKQTPKADFETIIFQNNLVSELKNQKKSEYYIDVDLAEDLILKRKHGDAKEQYRTILTKYSRVYAQDIHNAIRCAILNRDEETAFLWSEKMAMKGVGIAYFNAKVFEKMRMKPRWESFSKKYDSIYQLNSGRIDHSLRKKMNELLEEDQADYGLKNRKSPPVLYATTERVTQKLIDLLKKEGYPSEEKIGVLQMNDTILASETYHVIIRHAVQQKPDNLSELMLMLDKSCDDLMYDKPRTPNHSGILGQSGFYIYKDMLYMSKSCGRNENMIAKFKFIFNNPNQFKITQPDYVVIPYEEKSALSDEERYRNEFIPILKVSNAFLYKD
jgi:hypothetical protein